MKLSNFVRATMILALLLTAANAFVKADLSGTWVMDKSRSEGLPEDMQQTMTVSLQGDKLSLETTLITGEQKQSVKDSYTLNGVAEDFTPRGGGGATGKGKRTAKWSADGNGIEVSEDSKFDSPDGEISATMKRKWQLSADGKTLVIELHFNGPNGEVNSKRTFVKQ
ncbi:MAG: hypothetical protein JNJ50_01810 [Acidobacteria bacterium]|nr:hypothetical protein [Acidobacteriota bacterium]